MLKHATPRSSPSLGSTSSTSSRLLEANKLETGVHKYSSSNGNPLLVQDYLPYSPETQIQKHFNERGVDCEGIVSAEPLQKKVVSTGGLSSLLADKFLGLSNFGVSGGGIGPVITQGRAIVRRGLSFNSKKEADSQSVRSVKSEGKDSETSATKLTIKSQSASVIHSENEEKSSNIGKDSTLLPSQKKDSSAPHFPKEDLNTKLLKDPIKVANNAVISKANKESGSTDNRVDHPTLKSLLRLPGVYGHIPVPENAPSNSPHIVSPDSLSLNSSNSFRSSNSGRTSSRSWESNASSTSNTTSRSSQSNCSSTSEPAAQTTLKVYAKCLRADIEYKTLSLDPKTTCRELIGILLSKVRMRHRDPNLFYLTMEVFVRKWSELPVRALLVLEENARPAQLSMCHPTGDIRFALQMRRGGVVKIHDTVLMPGSQYKSLLISYRTTTEEVVQLLLNCYCRKESKHYYALHEVCQYPEYSDRRLGYVERPLEVKAEWPKDRKAEYVFVLRRNMTQALSLRKLFMKTSEVLKENEEISARKTRNRILAQNNRNRLIRVEAEPGIVVPEEAALIDCTSVTPTMTTFRESAATATQKLPSDHRLTPSNAALEKPRKQILVQGPKPPPLGSTQVKMDGHQISPKNHQTQNSLSKAGHPKSIVGTKRVHFSQDPPEAEPPKGQPEGGSSNARREIPTRAVVNNTKVENTPSPFISRKPLTSNSNLRFSIGAQTELTLISVKGFKANTHKWNSVETLIESTANSASTRDAKLRHEGNRSFEETSSHLEIHQPDDGRSKLKHCEHNCQKCFYI